MEREIIDAIPTEPAQQPPAQAVIRSAVQSSSGTVRLIYDADRGTSFDVLQKPTGVPGDFSVVGNDVIVREFHVNGLAPGSYDFAVIACNSRGPGPRSEPTIVVVV